MSGRLKNKVALITGGSSGIGFAVAREFAAEGATLYITGRRQRELNTATTLLGMHATGVRADTTSMDDMDALFAQGPKYRP